MEDYRRIIDLRPECERYRYSENAKSRALRAPPEGVEAVVGHAVELPGRLDLEARRAELREEARDAAHREQVRAQRGVLLLAPTL